MKTKRDIIQCPFIYLSFTTLNLNRFFFFFKKFKYLLGTQVRKKKTREKKTTFFLLKQRQNISFIFRLKNTKFPFRGGKKNESNL